MKRTIGINVACLFPHCLFPLPLRAAIWAAHVAGFDGVQALPVRGLNRFLIERILSFGIKIISMEKAWNCGSLFGAIKRHVKLAGEENPLAQDYLLFGNCERVANTEEMMIRILEKEGTILVTHNRSTPGIVEMNPECALPIAQYASDWIGGVVWDTEHIIRRGRHGESPITSDWKELLKMVCHNIRLIHVKPGAPKEMLEALAKCTDCPIILEIMPPITAMLSPWKLKAWMRERYVYLKTFFG